jgi:hypothetical protein
MERLSIKGAINVGKLLESISTDEIQVLISLDEFQSIKPKDSEKHYTVEIIYPNFSGEHFEKVSED